MKICKKSLHDYVFLDIEQTIWTSITTDQTYFISFIINFKCFKCALLKQVKDDVYV